MAITLNQIAEICGVSRGTVDRALHNKGNVRPAVAERIKAVQNVIDTMAAIDAEPYATEQPEAR